MPQRKRLTAPPLACLSFRTACNALFGTTRSNQGTQPKEKESHSETSKYCTDVSNSKQKSLTASHSTRPGSAVYPRVAHGTIEIGYPRRTANSVTVVEVEKAPSSHVCQETESVTASDQKPPCYITYSTDEFVGDGCPDPEVGTHAECECADFTGPADELKGWIDEIPAFRADFYEAITQARSYGVEEVNCRINTPYDYVKYVKCLLETPPYQDGNSRCIYQNLALFYFIMNQPSLQKYQDELGILAEARKEQRAECEKKPIELHEKMVVEWREGVVVEWREGVVVEWREGVVVEWRETMPAEKPEEMPEYVSDVSCIPCSSQDIPGVDSAPKKGLNPNLTEWMKRFACCWGKYLCTEDSAKCLKTFKCDALFHWTDYVEPPGGFKTFNQYFSRKINTWLRPVARPYDDHIVVFPADSTMVGWWYIDNDATLFCPEELILKGIRWKISKLLRDCKHGKCFAGGLFTHSFLSTYNYHRLHSPVRGTVKCAHVIQGECYLYVDVKTTYGFGGRQIKSLNITDGTGFQFFQTRGVVIIESETLGYVAALPIGMAQVSSVKLTVKEGDKVEKGQEIGYFLFGGSDFVTVFQNRAQIQIVGTPNVQSYVGQIMGISRHDDRCPALCLYDCPELKPVSQR